MTEEKFIKTVNTVNSVFEFSLGEDREKRRLGVTDEDILRKSLEAKTVCDKTEQELGQIKEELDSIEDELENDADELARILNGRSPRQNL